MSQGENIYKRKDGRWEGRYPKERNTKGIKKYGYVYGKTLQEVRDSLDILRLTTEIIDEKESAFSISFKEWGDRWLREVANDVKPATLSSYSYKLNKYVFPLFGELCLDQINSDRCESLIDYLKKEGLSTSSIRVIYLVLNKCLKMALSKNYLTVNPLERVTIPKVKRRRVRALSIKEQKKLEEAAFSMREKGLPTILSLYTGLRIGEIAALKWDDIDFYNNYLFVRNTFQRVTTVFGNSKTSLILNSSKTDSSERIVPIGKKLKKLLLEHQENAHEMFVFSTNNHPTEPRVLTNHFHQIREKADLNDIHFHQLRHTFATRCLEKKADISSVSALLGHASTQMTLDTYADALLEQRIKVIASIEK